MSKIVKRTLDFFELFDREKRPLSLSEISRLLDIPMSSCFDVIRSLQQRGYVYELGHRAGYYPTQRIVRLAKTISENDPIMQRAGLILRDLRDEFDESVSLSQVTGHQAKYLLVFEPTHALRFTVTVGNELRSLHATSAGKSVLAMMPPDEFEHELSKPLASLTEHTITDPELLRQDIAVGKERGYFINRQESALAIVTVTVPFTWDRTVFLVTMAGPDYRMEPRIEDAVRRIKEVCEDLSQP